MRLVITRTTPVYSPLSRSGVFVQWDLTEQRGYAPLQSLGQSEDFVMPATGATFSLGRSESPRGPFTEVARDIATPHFYDAHIASTTGTYEAWEQRALLQPVYYCVRMADAVTGAPLAQAVAEVGDALPRAHGLRRRKMQRDFALALKVGSGILVAIAKVKHWGQRCTRCYNALTKSVLDNDCPVCFSTGFVGGYHDPVLVRARKGVTAVRTSLPPTGPTDVNAMAFWMLDYPLLQKEDLIVEIASDRRYEVTGVTRTESRGVAVHQRAEISELMRDNTAYSVPVPRGSVPSFGA